MHINKTSDYAIRCLLTLAAEDREMSSAEIAEKVGVGRPLTMNILRLMRKAGLVNSGRGAEGGYWLAKGKDEISLFDILSIMEESMYINHCLDPNEKCSRHAEGTCPVRKYYESLQKTMHDSLASMTLERILSEATEATPAT